MSWFKKFYRAFIAWFASWFGGNPPTMGAPGSSAGGNDTPNETGDTTIAT